MSVLTRAVAALLPMLLLSACLVTPGKFDSTLDIRADRSFTFTYKGEIIASDMGKDLPGPDGLGDEPTDDAAPTTQDSVYHMAGIWRIKDETAEQSFANRKNPGDDAKMQAIAEALTKEKGFRAARYMGDHKFEIDYAISGRLDHAFLFPFNTDAQIVLPFVAVELRGADRLRVKAPGFSTSYDKSQGPSMGGSDDDAAKALDGTFTLTTDAEIVAQNQEDGAQDTPQGKRIVWKVTPMTSDAPSATLRVKP
ncbi:MULTISPECIES: hypothetical protein [Sphingobium]|jgi:hypothetical protein|uniref:Uncharacterized protein n=1 Tax=Sphingobium baderi TaxID=1332080 RepID=A0A0S3EU43_9SPHN|nr:MULTISPECIES: hypothetical protein [Sphingobium]ALR18957.1 hypothetical protein ATN00_00135 [Sphingobium baderi]